MIKNFLLILSGKGGVGKSSICAELAITLTSLGLRVGVLDADLCGPSMARIFDVTKEKIRQGAKGWEPVIVKNGIKVMSLAFLLPNPDDAVIWRGPKKGAMLRQFLEQVNWGEELDVLLVDTPPGTSDEHLFLAETLPKDRTHSILVTTPQIISVQDVERELLFCRELNIPILGLIENKRGYECPHCQHCTLLFSAGGGESLAAKYEIPFLGYLPIVPHVAELMESSEKSLIEELPKTNLWPQLMQITNQFSNKFLP